jgi:hypothetical protein
MLTSSKTSEPNLESGSKFAKFMKKPDQTGPRHQRGRRCCKSVLGARERPVQYKNGFKVDKTSATANQSNRPDHLFYHVVVHGPNPVSD